MPSSAVAVCCGGVSARGCLPGGYLPTGVSAHGGVSAEGGVSAQEWGWWIPACTEADTPYPLVGRILDTHF